MKRLNFLFLIKNENDLLYALYIQMKTDQIWMPAIKLRISAPSAEAAMEPLQRQNLTGKPRIMGFPDRWGGGCLCKSAPSTAIGHLYIPRLSWLSFKKKKLTNMCIRDKIYFQTMHPRQFIVSPRSAIELNYYFQ